MSRDDIAMSFDDMSLSGGGDAVVSGVDEYVCGVNSVLAAGVLDLCDGDTVLSGVDEHQRIECAAPTVAERRPWLSLTRAL